MQTTQTKPDGAGLNMAEYSFKPQELKSVHDMLDEFKDNYEIDGVSLRVLRAFTFSDKFLSKEQADAARTLVTGATAKVYSSDKMHDLVRVQTLIQLANLLNTFGTKSTQAGDWHWSGPAGK